MDNPTVTLEALKRYALAAHAVGFTGDAIIQALITHAHDHFTEGNITDILKGIKQSPKKNYPWYNWGIRATNGQIPLGSYPWKSWSSRYIWNCKAKNETNSTIFAKMRKRGYEIPGEHWVEVVLEARLFIENELAHGCDDLDDAALQKTIVMAHNWGYTLPEITCRIPGRTLGPNQSISKIATMVKMALESNGIPEAQHRKGRGFAVVAQEFVLSARSLGIGVNDIQDQLYVHGFNHDAKPIVDFLEKKGLWQGQDSERMTPIQEAQPTQPKARDYVLHREGEIAPQSVPANQEPGRKIHVMDLLN